MSAAPDAQRLALYQALTEAEVVEAEGGGILASVHPADPSLGTLGAPWGNGAVQAIRAGERWLAARGCKRVMGPMEVCTWFPYRARLGPAEAPAFFGEPTAGAAPWVEAGYEATARYASTVVRCAEAVHTGEARRPPGVLVRRLGDVSGALEAIHHLAHAAFSRALAFAPLPLPALEALYRPLLGTLEPDLVLFAERDGEPLAFILGVPDTSAGAARRFVAKTLAVHPAAQGEGLGTWLTGELHRAAAHHGFSEGVHALMWQESRSQRICRDGARPLREYVLFARELG